MVRKPVLIVDDEPIVRESIRDWLEVAGYRVATAETALSSIESSSTSCHRRFLVPVKTIFPSTLRPVKNV